MKQVFALVDLGYGDSGKGSITDALTRKFNAHTVVRYNGGAQAAHNVVTPDGKHHTFSQWGSGTLAGARTYLSQHVLIDPGAMLNEARHLSELRIDDPFSMLSVNENALVVTPFQKVANWLREEWRDSERHGSCGMGIGETRSDSAICPEAVVIAKDMADRVQLERKLRMLWELKREQLRLMCGTAVAERFDAMVNEHEFRLACLDVMRTRIKIVSDTYSDTLLIQDGTLIFEGAQGVLLDETHGFAPYTTWTNTTLDNVKSMMYTARINLGSILPLSVYVKPICLGLMRAYMTRHGAGPFVTEDANFPQLEAHNETGRWQGSFRYGYLDFVALNYAIACVEQNAPLDGLVVSHLDELRQLPTWAYCDSYDLGANNALREIEISNRAYDEQDRCRFTKILEQCQPRLTTVERDEYEYVAAIEEHLDKKILIRSYGPTANDKVIKIPT